MLNMEKIPIIYEYLEYQNKYEEIYGKDTIVIMQVGDFWEMYAIIDNGFDLLRISEITNLARTRKYKSKPVSIKNPYTCGFGLISLDRYLKMLLDANLIVVQVSQITLPPKPKRGLTAIYSPGTFTSNTILKSNYIVSIYIQNDLYMGINIVSIGLCSIDTSTGTCAVYEISGNINDNCMPFDEAYRFILNYAPKEVVIIGETNTDIVTYLELEKLKIHYMPTYDKEFERIVYQNNFFGKIYNQSLLSPIESLNLEYMNYARLSFIILLNFINEYDKSFIKYLNYPEIFISNNHLILYNDAIQQLNILENIQQTGTKIKCLYDVVNHCVTAPGKRFMKYAICNPLNNIDAINLRYDCTEELIQNKLNLDEYLRQIADIQKLTKKILSGKITPNELTIVVESCEIINQLYHIIKNTTYNAHYLPDSSIIDNMNNFINSCRHIFNFIKIIL